MTIGVHPIFYLSISYLPYGRSAVESKTRSLFCYGAVKKLGAKVMELARKFDQIPTAITVTVRRGVRLAEGKGYVFDKPSIFLLLKSHPLISPGSVRIPMVSKRLFFEGGIEHLHAVIQKFVHYAH